MNILYTCDDNYIWLMGISTISLFENNKELVDLTVYLLGENISNENKRILEDIAQKYNRKIIVIDVPQIDIPDSLVTARWPLSAFTRLFIGALLPEDVNKILYLDCDTIIKGKLDEVEKINIDSCVCAGVKDCIGKIYKENIGLQGNDIYINAGVIYFNLEEIRKIEIRQAIDVFMNKYLKLINYADQDILNGIFKGKIKVIPPQFNVMTILTVYSHKEISRLRKPTNYYSEAELENAKANPSIIHYTTNMRVIRPWFLNSNHPMANDFEKYMSISPWCDKELKEVKILSFDEKIFCFFNLLPRKFSQKCLGIIHSELKPRYIRIRAKL